MLERNSAGGSISSWVVAAAIGGGTVILCLLLWRQGIGNGTPLVGAARILSGEIPYRDFWTMYAPGHYYLLAALFALFGKHILTSTVSAAVLSGLAATAVFRLGLALAGRALPACVLTAMFVAALLWSGYHQFLGSYPPAIACIVIALVLFTSALRRGSLGDLLGAGFVVGLAAVFKHDIGAYTFAAMVAGLLAHHLLQPAPPGGRARPAIRDVAALTAAATAPVLVVVALLAPVAGAEMFDQLIRFPATDFQHTRPEWYPRWFPRLEPGLSTRRVLSRLGEQVPFVLAMAVWAVSIMALITKGPRKAPIRAALGTTFASLWLLHHAAAHVQINTHVVALTLYAGALGLLALDALGIGSGSSRPWLGRLAIATAGLWVALLAFSPADELRWRLGIRDRLAPLPGATTEGVLFFESDVARIERLRELIEENTLPGQPIFVGEHRHDVVVISHPALYFLVDRPVVGRYHELHPGVADTASVQREIIDAIESQQTPLLVLVNSFADETLDRILERQRKNLPEAGATELDRYILEHYEQRERLSGWDVWLRRPVTVMPTTEGGAKAGSAHRRESSLQ